MGLTHDTVGGEKRDAPVAAPAPVAAAPMAPVPLPVGPETLMVGHAEDHAEADADRRADVALARLSRSSTAVAVEPDPHQHDPGCGHLRRSETAAPSGAIGYAGGALSTDTDSRISRLRGGGAPLPAPVLRRMETAFGTSFSGVKIHDSNEAAGLNRDVSAKAFTTGKDIFFGAGEFRPDTADGERTLAHELAHTLQGDAGVHRLPSWLTNIFKSKPLTPDEVKEKSTKADQAGEKADFAAQRADGDAARAEITDKVGAHVEGAQAAWDNKSEAGKLRVAQRGAERTQTAAGREGLTAEAFGADGMAAIILFKRAVAKEKELLATAERAKGSALNEDERRTAYDAVWKETGEFADVFSMAPTRANKQELELRDLTVMAKTEEEGDATEVAARMVAHKKVADDVNAKRTEVLNARTAAPAADVVSQPWWSRHKPQVSNPQHAASKTKSRGLLGEGEQGQLAQVAQASRAAALPPGRTPPPLPPRPGFKKAAATVEKAEGDLETVDSAAMEPSRATTALVGAVKNHQGADPSKSDDDQYTSDETKASDAFGLAKDIASHLFTAFDHVKQSVEIYDNWGTADQATKLEIAKTAFDMAGNAVKLAKDAASVAGMITPELAKAVGKVIPGFNIVIAVKSLIDGIMDSVSANSARRAAVQALFDARVASATNRPAGNVRAGDRVGVAVPTLEHAGGALNLRLSRAINDAIGGVVSMITSIGSVATLGAMALVEAADGVRSLLHSIVNTLIADSRARAAQASRRHGALEGGALERLTHDPKVVARSLINQARNKNDATVRTFLKALGLEDSDIDTGPLVVVEAKILEAVQESADPETTVDKLTNLYRRVTA